MKKILLIISVLLLVLSCNKQKSDLEIIKSTVEPDTAKKIKEQVVDEEKKPLIMITRDDELQIMVRADGAPGMFLNDNDELEGFYVELEKAVMEEMGQKYKLVPYTDLGPLLQNLKSGESHSALATPILADFKVFLNISNRFEILKFVIFVQKDSELAISENKEEAIKSLYGKKVGVQTRGHIYQLLRDYKDIEIIEYPTTTIAIEALNKGEVDAVPEVKRIGLYYSEKNGWNVKPVGPSIFSLDIGTGFSQALDPSVIDRYNAALTTLIDNGYVSKLYKSYFGE